MELPVVEQRHLAVREALDGAKIIDIATATAWTEGPYTAAQSATRVDGER